jgi:hypothetical protein
MTTVSHLENDVPAGWSFSPSGGGPGVPATGNGSWTRMEVTWHAVINYLVPIGYQDETGFHYGEGPVPGNATGFDE